MKNFSKNSEDIKKLFNKISGDYDKLNNIMSLGLHNIIKNNVTKNLPLKPDAKILDLCTGTGDLARILKNKYPTTKVIGVDFSPKMLDIAKVKHPDLEFIEADCADLPFNKETFDLCIISFGLRNVEDIEKVLTEINRILKPGGIFINIDLGKPNKFCNIFLKPYMYFWISLMGKFFHGDQTPYEYLAVSNEDFPSQSELIEIYEKIGFKNPKNKNYVFGQIASQICIK